MFDGSEKIKKEELIDLHTIKINRNLDKAQRDIQFIKQIKNPYKYTNKGIVVNVEYTSNGKTFKENFSKVLEGFNE